MNAIIQTQFDRVETALTALIDSITNYNPSIPAAQDLLSADEALTLTLDQLSTHQINYSRILSLRATISTLDNQITSTLTTLAALRAEILATPATVLPPDPQRREVPLAELLDYAKNISRNTVPPTFRPREKSVTSPQRDSDGVTVVIQPAQPAVDLASSSSFLSQQQQQPQQPTSQTSIPVDASSQQQQPSQTLLTNGTSTASATQSSFFSSQPALPSSTQATSVSLLGQGPTETLPATHSSINIGIAALSAQEQQWLHPLAQIPFVPWPSADVIGRSALGQIQGVRVGVDEGGPGAAVEEGRLKNEEKEKMEGVAMGNGREEQGRRERRRESRVEERPTVFAGGLDLYDPEDE